MLLKIKVVRILETCTLILSLTAVLSIENNIFTPVKFRFVIARQESKHIYAYTYTKEECSKKVN